VCWRYEHRDGKLTKVPYCATTGKLAATDEPWTWSEFNVAHAAVERFGYSGIGFVLTASDPFCFIDLDAPNGDPIIIERYNKILQAFDSYSEVSPSGQGMHIICKATLPQGRRRNKIEMYSSGRYMTVTGLTYQDRPIAEREVLAGQLWDELQITPKELFEAQSQPEQFTDKQIYDIASTAENADKFNSLWSGQFQTYYQSQSEADFALINILGFYSRNIEQIRRMFRQSGLGQRKKANREAYVDPMIKRSFDNMPLPVDVEGFKAQIASQLAAQATPDNEEKNPFAGPLFASVPDPNYDWTVPPGLLGEITQFIYAAAPRPVKEVALSGAIGLMAGICGRAYNVSATGLNQYVLLLAKTGIGKEGAASGIDRLIEQVKQQVPAVNEFIGPAEIASGQALIKYICKQPSFVCILGEIGLALQQMCLPSASPAQVTLRRKMLELYMKSGKGSKVRATIYSDADKNTPIVDSPAFSLFGESTPENFYKALDESSISEGLLPRFTCIEYFGKRPPLNEGHISVHPSEKLVQAVAEVAANALALAHNGRVINVEFDAEAEAISRKINCKYDERINNSEIEVARQLWNRAHLKCIKLAALVAVGINPFKPTITAEAMEWSVTLIERDITNILKQFETGNAGMETGEVNQINRVCEAVSRYFKMTLPEATKYDIPPGIFADKFIPTSFLQKRLLANRSFSMDRIGASASLKRAIQSLISEGALAIMNPIEAKTRYETRAQILIPTDLKRFR
jgi:hypothetical protein